MRNSRNLIKGAIALVIILFFGIGHAIWHSARQTGQQIAQNEQLARSNKNKQPANQGWQNNRAGNANQPVTTQVGPPTEQQAEAVMTPTVKAQLGPNVSYDPMGYFMITNAPELKTNVASAPYVSLPRPNPEHHNRLEGSARAWLNHSSRQYRNRNQTGNGRGSYKPLGFQQMMGLDKNKTGYNHLYDRGHLIAYAIAGNVRHFNASESNPQNIVTQTAWSNESANTVTGQGQNYFEGIVRQVLDQNQQVMYVVTPIYQNNNDIVPCGMHLQAATKQKQLFNVFIPNIQRGIKINYATGQGSLE